MVEPDLKHRILFEKTFLLINFSLMKLFITGKILETNIKLTLKVLINFPYKFKSS